MMCKDTARTLPDIPNLIRISKAIAMLDAILSEEWEYRFYSFNSHWDKNDPTQQMASMRNGCGDHYFIWFSTLGAAIKGFDHESPMSPANNGERVYPGVLSEVPAEFSSFLNEPAFIMGDTTFCLWRHSEDDEWHTGNVNFPGNAGAVPDGSKSLLAILDGKPSSYVRFASEYFELDIDEEDVEHVYNLKPLTAELLERLQCERSLDELRDDMLEIGYP